VALPDRVYSRDRPAHRHPLAAHVNDIYFASRRARRVASSYGTAYIGSCGERAFWHSGAERRDSDGSEEATADRTLPLLEQRWGVCALQLPFRRRAEAPPSRVNNLDAVHGRLVFVALFHVLPLPHCSCFSFGHCSEGVLRLQCRGAQSAVKGGSGRRLRVDCRAHLRAAVSSSATVSARAVVSLPPPPSRPPYQALRFSSTSAA